MITGKALCRLADTADSPERNPGPRRQSSAPNQRLFAWIAIPILAVLIALGLADLRRLRPSLAYPGGREQRRPPLSYSWLGGYWIDENADDVLCFGYVNPTAHGGAYTRISRDGAPARIVRFQIVHEEATDARLVLRELDESPQSAVQQSDGSNAILYISRGGTSMIRMTTHQREPVLTTYRHMDKPPDR